MPTKKGFGYCAATILALCGLLSRMYMERQTGIAQLQPCVESYNYLHSLPKTHLPDGFRLPFSTFVNDTRAMNAIDTLADCPGYSAEPDQDGYVIKAPAKPAPTGSSAADAFSFISLLPYGLWIAAIVIAIRTARIKPVQGAVTA